MPPKGRAVHRSKEASSSSATSAPTSTSAQPPPPPSTVNEQSQQRERLLNASAHSVKTGGVSSLSPAERSAWLCAPYLGASATSAVKGWQSLSNKAQKELWRLTNEASLPLRRQPPLSCRRSATTLDEAAPPPPPLPFSRSPSLPSPPPPTLWGRDRSGRDVGEYTLAEFQKRSARRLELTVLQAEHWSFLEKRDSAASQAASLTPQEIEEERQRRQTMATLRTELYGEPAPGSLAQDPAWDDVEPIPLVEPEGALAAIAYPDDYAEAISYLRAVMTSGEYSPRCLKLTEQVISLNPAHYTVWLYRFAIVKALQLPVVDELAWLNEVAMQNLKNYQIWHHRYLLVELYYPQIAADPERVAAFARREMAFLTDILAEDTKNYHVWSFRQYLVKKLGYWNDDERRATEAFIRQDVRNNSAWSHRFFLVFSDPAVSPPAATAPVPAEAEAEAAADSNTGGGLEASVGRLNIGHDPSVPASLIEREILYAEARILEAPQNESPWNYLRGVLSKGGRPLASVEDFATQFVQNIGDAAESAEVVQSTHAMDLLAAIYEEKGDKAKAELYLKRLAEKWDPIRAGYWAYRTQML